MSTAARQTASNRVWLLVGGGLLLALVVASAFAPANLSVPQFDDAYQWPTQSPPLGRDERGIPLVEYALQGASIVTLPALLAGVLVAALAAVAGLARCAGVGWFDTALQAFSELMGALPRLVVVLVVALGLPMDYRGLVPIALTWALLAAPSAMDEAASAAGRLGGTRFVEALRAHGFSAGRIYGYHITWLNLRAVLVRQAAEVMMQVVFLEIALSYLAAASSYPALTHSDSTYSWAALLYMGFTTIASGAELFGDRSLLHALVLGVALVIFIAGLAQALRLAARER